MQQLGNFYDNANFADVILNAFSMLVQHRIVVDNVDNLISIFSQREKSNIDPIRALGLFFNIYLTYFRSVVSKNSSTLNKARPIVVWETSCELLLTLNTELNVYKSLWEGKLRVRKL